MIFVFDVTIPSNTPKSKSYIVKAPLPRGVIHKIDIHFPPGPSGLVGVRVTRSGRPVYPSNPKEWFVTDNETITFPEYYVIDNMDPPFEIHGYNEDDTYDHTITFRFGVLPIEVVTPQLVRIS